ncbi:MAG TPA: Gfo/Idh/MocA family oxidoreductase, partial [Spirochaetes bacterium]|nr:Gfo/Idh/MocA family oxidoreductase [Spirochaetota bacterium]
MKTYGVGVYGIGWVAGAHIDAMLQNPQLKIAALGSRRKESAEKKNEEIGGKAKIVTSFEEMLKMDDVDIIDITTPNVLHAEETIAAAEAGKHVIIEKPIAMNFKELVAIKK